MIKELDAVIWCPACHTYYAQVFRVQQKEGIWANEVEPPDAPARCTRCETILERQRK